ncbi:hypothetical protein ACH4OW_36715 [Streptomyces sp. NPDC017056]|uniref:hypothetical protein n=1 Tax=Streptomyces sp. NPDC017056 TaxID=3364973 RepID=UPI00379C376C
MIVPDALTGAAGQRQPVGTPCLPPGALPDWIPRGAGLRVVRDVAGLGVDVVWLALPVGEEVLRGLGRGQGR